MNTTDLKRTPLNQIHRDLKARMVPFGGWDMPVQYSGLMQEHEAVRHQAGLFDVSHMGEFLVTGSGALSFLQSMLTNDISKIPVGGCQYTLMCYDNGTVVDDLIVSCVAVDRYFLVVNAGNIEKDFNWLKDHLPQNHVELTNLSADYGLLALQGPQAEKILTEYFKTSFSDLKYYHFQVLGLSYDQAFVGDHRLNTLLVSRTGYTGEDGFEILIPNAQLAQVWTQLLSLGADFGLVPVGLGARDTLRLEASYSLYGHEISDQITGLEAKLGWVIKLDKTHFVGKESLLKEKNTGSSRKIVGFEMCESGIAREGYKVLTKDGHEVGFVTSGTHSPTLKKSIGLALIKSDLAVIGTELYVDVRGKNKLIKCIKTPFYKRG